MLGHKTSVNKFKQTEIISVIFLWQWISIEINYRKKTRKNHKYMRIKQHATEQPMGQWRNQIKYYEKKYVVTIYGDSW